jgi:hypothetical protein
MCQNFVCLPESQTSQHLLVLSSEEGTLGSRTPVSSTVNYVLRVSVYVLER